MIYVPPRWQRKHLKEPILKIMYHLKRKRAAIDMRDNEVMVQRTIREFKDLYVALVTYFRREIETGRPTPLTQFMFTRFATKLISFRRRIGTLLGYTGGESIEQIALDPRVAALPARTYPPMELGAGSPSVQGDKELWVRLPDLLKKHPARFIETLPNYNRPSLNSWLKERGMFSTDRLTVGDLVNLGFDPTRLKEIVIEDEKFIFERMQIRQMAELTKKETLLGRVRLHMPHAKPGNAQLRVNPPLLTIRDRGNVYVLRRKVEGIHWEEAIEQLQSIPHLKNMNGSMKLDRVILGTVRSANQMISKTLGLREETVGDLLTCFIPWDLESNQPRLMIDFTQVYLECVWMA
jgi:hypothetical protein